MIETKYLIVRGHIDKRDLTIRTIDGEVVEAPHEIKPLEGHTMEYAGNWAEQHGYKIIEICHLCKKLMNDKPLEEKEEGECRCPGVPAPAKKKEAEGGSE